jgi:acetylornithine deacetylase/succinyl-diaminopimelate desuccinylase-like protein
MTTRDQAVAAAVAAFDDGRLRARLTDLVAIPSTSQDPAYAADLRRYLSDGLGPWLRELGFAVTVHDNPDPSRGPILVGIRMEQQGLPTVLTYGHGDTVRGLDEQWHAGRKPWTMSEENGRWYGRGTADNKGQHAINLTALEAVLRTRGGRLGFNLKLVIETAEERGSGGLGDFVAAHKDLLAADVLIGSDGPRVTPDTPTVATGTRGTFHFDLVCDLRPGGVHSGHWGGLTRDPAVLVAHAIASIIDVNGRIAIREWLPPGGVAEGVRGVLAGCPVDSGGEGATIDAGWGEPGLTPAEKIFASTGFIVLSMLSGRPENPVNAVAPNARAHCQIRYTVDVDPARFMPALRAHLDAHGLQAVTIERPGTRMAASRTDPAHPWVRWTADSVTRTLGRKAQVIPNAAGGLPGDVFADHLGVPLVWVPHSYNGCGQHGPDEHLLTATAREGLAAFAGIWWDLGDRAAVVGATGIEPVTPAV